MASETIDRATAHFAKLVEEQLARVERMKQAEPPLDFGAIRPIKVGICFGDGIGPIISKQTMRVLEGLLADEIAHGRVELRTIEGLTIENRVAHLKAIPDDVLSELKACHVILKAPTTTPEKGGPYPNIESANVAMRRALDLYANVRPVKVPKDGIDWVIFRENTTIHAILQTLVDRRNKFARNNTTFNGVNELITLTGFIRFNFDPNVTELPTTT